MNTQIKPYFLFCIILLFSACDNLLDTSPKDFVPPENYYNNKKQLDGALTGVYSIMKSSAFYADNYQYIFTSGTDECVNTYATMIPTISYYNSNPGDMNIRNFWNILYTGINRANLLLENIDKPEDITSDEKQIIKGEAKFLRAYYYFILVQWFGDVPLRLSSTKSNLDTNFPFTKSSDIYNFIIDEMRNAEELLELQKASSLNYNERVTQSAVQAILARVCLYAAGHPINDTKRYSDAEFWAQKVVDSELHSLNPDYSQIFKLQSADGYDNIHRESIWEVGFNWNSASPEQSSGSQVRVGMFTEAASIGNTFGRTYVTPQLFCSYESVVNTNAKTNFSPDLRREWCVPSYKWSGGDETTLPTKTPYEYNAYYGRFPGKWRREFEEVTPRNHSNSPRNLPIIRYSDVLLMLAESKNEQRQSSSDIVSLINQVRKRAYGDLISGRSLFSIEITNRGSGYITPPNVTIKGGGGRDAKIVAFVSGGQITSLALINPGTGYTSDPTLEFSGGGGTGASAKVHISNPEIQATDYDELKKLIQRERLLELNGEFLRRQDLKRWGILTQMVRNVAADALSGSDPAIEPVIPTAPASMQSIYTLPGSNVSDKDTFLPIPQAEITYNSFAKQNQGF